MMGLMAHWNQNATALLRGCEGVVAGAFSASFLASRNHCVSTNALRLRRHLHRALNAGAARLRSGRPRSGAAPPCNSGGHP